MKPKVLIEISGGVACVTSDSKEIDIAVIDYDVDGCPISQSIRNPQTGCADRAAISQIDHVDPKYVDKMFMQL